MFGRKQAFLHTSKIQVIYITVSENYEILSLCFFLNFMFQPKYLGFQKIWHAMKGKHKSYNTWSFVKYSSLIYMRVLLCVLVIIIEGNSQFRFLTKSKSCSASVLVDFLVFLRYKIVCYVMITCPSYLREASSDNLSSFISLHNI